MTDPAPAYETILVDVADGVALITLNRPQALNALNAQMMRDMTGALQALDADARVGAIVIAGSPKAFAAGADIKEMQSLGLDVKVGGRAVQHAPVLPPVSF